MDHAQLREALEKAEELCFHVNEGVREKENSDRLEWIQNHVQCEGITEVTRSNSITYFSVAFASIFLFSLLNNNMQPKFTNVFQFFCIVKVLILPCLNVCSSEVHQCTNTIYKLTII